LRKYHYLHAAKEHMDWSENRW